jgi:hypothetical protein
MVNCVLIGAFGVVHLVQNTLDRRQYAFKVLKRTI